MQRFLTAIDRVCDIGGFIAALAAAILAVMLIIEVGLTSFAAMSQPWAVEYSGYLLSAILFAGSGWTLRQGGHIRVNALIAILPYRARRAFDLAATTFAIGLLFYVAVAVSHYALRSFEFGTTSYYPTRTPLFYPQALLALSFWILLLAFVARFLRICRGDAPDRGEPVASSPGDEAA